MDLRWQHDNEVNSCYLCHGGFNLFNRRHHCRKCGKIVCGDCSSQPIKYFPRTMIVEKGQVMRLNPYEIYRTCDNCVEEIKMIRRAIFDDDDDSSVEVDHHDGGGDNNSVTKYSSRMMTRTLNSSHASSIRDDISDQNLCPICAINLSDIVKGWKGDFESFKEHHINECLINHDFNLNHQRYEGNHPKNKMLVYNIPPIPQPKFESIVGSLDTIQLDSTKSNGHTSSSTNSNINNHHHHDVGDGTSTRAIMGSPMTNGKFDESFGSLNSNNTNTTIIEYDECVVCLEDLKPGDKVGRLECLCVFHYKCIKDWFNKKGYGECPVHYLQK